MSKQRLGKAIIKVAGKQLETMPGGTFDPGGITRTSQIGANAVLGYTEAPKQSRVEVTVSLTRGVTVRELESNSATLTIEGDTGQIWSIANAWSVEPPVVDLSAGTARVTYEGPPAEEL